ncbi:SDR family NAD(P)-dependent oxidoreductase [Novosphingobium sp. JCM 18896]|uniref:SDR family NAD(P)-dependent oxidoreductase n=1 Tax=Novosphingobium sp. JCM 18896 TaxID=2989731 RepID=UPI002223E72A|nr:glucose 1-dehydrogenase [Novosphingobium sp. JCM 18896]MCW1432282.1 glucose 1-dehydrogenase [Novosphingobium sp. JCM 18896]
MLQEAKALTDKVALITGAARGQGAAEARLFASEGAQVYLADILDEEGEELAREIAAAGYVHLDVGSEESWKAAIGQITSATGGIDILVNNAGISHFSPLVDTSLADFERLLQVNLISTFLGIRAATPLMAARGGGSIVNVGSIAGMTGRANLSAYSSTKWAVRGLTRSAAVELGPVGIRVNAIVPGLIVTPMTQEAYGETAILERGASLPIGRAGLPRDIANLALFLVSEASGFCTGGEYVCDGGQLAGF